METHMQHPGGRTRRLRPLTGIDLVTLIHRPGGRRGRRPLTRIDPLLRLLLKNTDHRHFNQDIQTEIVGPRLSNTGPWWTLTGHHPRPIRSEFRVRRLVYIGPLVSILGATGPLVSVLGTTRFRAIIELLVTTVSLLEDTNPLVSALGVIDPLVSILGTISPLVSILGTISPRVSIPGVTGQLASTMGVIEHPASILGAIPLAPTTRVDLAVLGTRE